MWTIFGQDAATDELNGKAGQAHAYVISGPDSIGKRVLAKGIFRSRVCTNGDECGGCGTCHQCERVNRCVHTDLQTLEMEQGATTIGIDAVKNTLQRLSLTGVEGETVAVVIDDADRMTTEAANSLLKTLEEPPPGALLILLTSRLDRLLPTVRSRCQNIRLAPVPTEALTRFLVNSGAEEDRGSRAAMRAQGRPGAAVRELAQAEEDGTFEPGWFDRIYQSSVQDRMKEVAEIHQTYRENRQGMITMLEEWRSWWRDRLVESVGMRRYQTGEPTDTRMKAADAVTGAEATEEARRLIQVNGNVRLALERLVLKMPSARKGSKAT